MEKSLILKNYAFNILMQLCGFIFIAFGNVLMIHANLGLNPWGILHQGISIQTHLTFGQAAQIVGLSIVVICIFFKIIPGLGTLLNMYFIGKFTDIVNMISFFHTPNSFFIRLIMLLFGLVILSIGMFLYIRENIGAGPRDGLMLLLNKKLNLGIGVIRTTMELVVFILGYLLGGKVGIGTIIIAFSLGPMLRYLFKTFNYDPKEAVHENIIDTYKRVFT